MYYVCECGEKFNEEIEGAVDHMLEQHLDLVETRFDDLLDCATDNEDLLNWDNDELYDDAILEVIDELLDEFND